MPPRATDLPGGGLDGTKRAVRGPGRSRAVTGGSRGPRAPVLRVRLAPATMGLPWGPWPGWWETATKGTHAGTWGLGNRPARQANDGSKNSKHPKRNGLPSTGRTKSLNADTHSPQPLPPLVRGLAHGGLGLRPHPRAAHGPTHQPGSDRTRRRHALDGGWPGPLSALLLCTAQSPEQRLTCPPCSRAPGSR